MIFLRLQGWARVMRPHRVGSKDQMPVGPKVPSFYKAVVPKMWAQPGTSEN